MVFESLANNLAILTDEITARTDTDDTIAYLDVVADRDSDVSYEDVYVDMNNEVKVKGRLAVNSS